MIHADFTARRFGLHTAHTSYWLAADDAGRLLHLYYGPLCRTAPALPPAPHNDPGCWPDRLPQEYPAPGLGDNHAPFFAPEWPDGTVAGDLRFAGAEVTPGKYALPGLPAFRDGDGAETLRLTLRDEAGLTVTLLYGVLPGCDVITRAAIVENTGRAPVTLRGVPSAVVDFAKADVPALDLITFDGDWAAERTPCRAAVRPGVQSVGSVGGIPTHAHNPFAVLCAPDAGEEHGACWGAALVYSGNYRIQAERTVAGVRLSLGIEPFRFAWTLAPGERFTTPEAAFVYSGAGLGGMSRAFHDAIRRHLIPPRWADLAAPRPVLLNSWEACYFDFDEAKLLALAAAAKDAHADLFVLDDGWFKGRDADTTSLGDWVADTRKLPGGVAGLCKKNQRPGAGFWHLGRAGSRQPRLGALPRPPRLGAAHPRARYAGHPQPVCAGFFPRRGAGKHLAAAHGAAGLLPGALPQMGYEPQPGQCLQRGAARRPPGRGLPPLCAGRVRPAAKTDRTLPRPAAGKLRRRRRAV